MVLYFRFITCRIFYLQLTLVPPTWWHPARWQIFFSPSRTTLTMPAVIVLCFSFARSRWFRHCQSVKQSSPPALFVMLSRPGAGICGFAKNFYFKNNLSVQVCGSGWRSCETEIAVSHTFGKPFRRYSTIEFQHIFTSSYRRMFRQVGLRRLGLA